MGNPEESLPVRRLNIICVKHGQKYSSEYVNKLYNMIERNLTVPFIFYCFTEDTSGLNNAIQIKLLPNLPIQGWWWKCYIFKKDHFENGINFYIDLDMVIISNIDHIVNYLPDQFVGLRDVGRVFNPNLHKLGSAVIKWPANTYCDIWDRFNPSKITLRGDQDWIWSLYNNKIVFFPDEWIKSYKWEIRNKNEIHNGLFTSIRNPPIPADTSILAFHGVPSLEHTFDPIILEHWK